MNNGISDLEHGYSSFGSDSIYAEAQGVSHDNTATGFAQNVLQGQHIVALVWNYGSKILLAGLVLTIVFAPAVRMHAMNLELSEFENALHNAMVANQTLGVDEQTEIQSALLKSIKLGEGLRFASAGSNNGAQTMTGIHSMSQVADAEPELSSDPMHINQDTQVRNNPDNCGLLSMKQCALAVQQNVCDSMRPR